MSFNSIKSISNNEGTAKANLKLGVKLLWWPVLVRKLSFSPHFIHVHFFHPHFTYNKCHHSPKITELRTPWFLCQDQITLPFVNGTEQYTSKFVMLQRQIATWILMTLMDEHRIPCHQITFWYLADAFATGFSGVENVCTEIKSLKLQSNTWSCIISLTPEIATRFYRPNIDQVGSYEPHS